MPVMISSLISALALLLMAIPAHAQIYKCISEENGIIYSDIPCDASDSQTLTDIMDDTLADEPPSLARKPPVILQLDTAVKSAIAVNDLTRAEALATTREHWEWIAEARKNTPKIETAQNQAESADCSQAKTSLEQEAGKPFPDAELLQVKQSLMYAACGISGPLEVVTEAPAASLVPFYGNPYAYPRHPHRHPYRNKHGWSPKPSGYTSPPYDRHKETPFGSRFIRPESTPR